MRRLRKPSPLFAEEEKGAAHEQRIPLTSLPEAVADRFMDTVNEMRFIVKSAKDETERERLAQRRARGIPDDPKPETTNAQQIGAPMIEDDPNRTAGRTGMSDTAGTWSPPPPPMGTTNPLPPAEDTSMPAMVHRVQLQRMLDDDPLLRDYCGTSKAIDIMRRFRVDATGGDPFDVVAKLQESVAKKLQEIEEKGVVLRFDEMETIRTVSQELHSALTESQREWRAELLSVLQMASLLSRALIDLTRRLEDVQNNHNKLSMQSGQS